MGQRHRDSHVPRRVDQSACGRRQVRRPLPGDPGARPTRVQDVRAGLGGPRQQSLRTLPRRRERQPNGVPEPPAAGRAPGGQVQRAAQRTGGCEDGTVVNGVRSPESTVPAIFAPMATKTRAPAPARTARQPSPLAKADLLDIYRLMYLARRLDDKEIQLKRQNKIFFQISGAGHEAILVAAGKALRSAYDWFYPYYRDRALCLAIGMTPLEMLLSAVGAKDDPNSGGRQMPSHWGHTRLNIPSQSSPTGTQCLQAVGCAEATLLYDRVTTIPERETKYHRDEITYVSIGEGGTSEGEFWESLNTASNKRLPLLYLIEDNGYAISVPVEVQTPGGDISQLVSSFPNLRIFRCDGTDFLASDRTMKDAVAHVREGKGPAFVHATVIRPYSHSLSDDEKLYKTAAEREAEARRDPLARMRFFLTSEGLATEADLADLQTSVDREVNAAAEQAL